MNRGRRRVLHVAWWYPSPERPLVGDFVAGHVRAAARDNGVIVLAFDEVQAAASRMLHVSEAMEEGVPVVRVTHRALPGSAGIALAAPGALLAAARLTLRHLRPDVVHAHMYMGGLVAAPLARAWGVPLVVSEHYSGFQLGTLSRPGRVAAIAALRAARVVTTPSESLRRALLSYAAEARVRVVPNVVDSAVFHPAAAPAPPGERLLFAGNLEDVKGVPVLLEALALLRRSRPGITLELLGDGSRRTDYEQLARSLGLGNDAVAFRGATPKPAVAKAMRAADVLVVPSRTETFGTVVAEAMVTGVPVVASRVGALPELLDREAGWLVAPDAPQELASAIGAVLDERAAGRLHTAAIADASRYRFGPDAVADAWDEIYDEATACFRRGT